MAISDSFMRGMEIMNMLEQRDIRRAQEERHAMEFQQKQDIIQKQQEAAQEAMVARTKKVEQTAPEDAEFMIDPPSSYELITGFDFNPQKYVEALQKKNLPEQAAKMQETYNKLKDETFKLDMQEKKRKLDYAALANDLFDAGDEKQALALVNQFADSKEEEVISIKPMEGGRYAYTYANGQTQIINKEKLNAARVSVETRYKEHEAMLRLRESLGAMLERAKISAAKSGGKGVLSPKVTPEEVSKIGKPFLRARGISLDRAKEEDYATSLLGRAKQIQAIAAQEKAEPVDISQAMRMAHDEKLRAGALKGTPSKWWGTNWDYDPTIDTDAFGNKPEPTKAKPAAKVDKTKEGKVRVQSPDGKSGWIPKENLPKALAAGYILLGANEAGAEPEEDESVL